MGASGGFVGLWTWTYSEAREDVSPRSHTNADHAVDPAGGRQHVNMGFSEIT
jgi:hypothetical protein